MTDPSEELLSPEPQGRGQTLLRALRLYWPWVLVGAVLFAVVAYAVSAERSGRYRASGNVFLFTAQDAPVPVAGQTVDPVRRVRNEAAVMMSREVANRVSKRLGTMTPADVLSAVTATPSRNTDIITLSASAGSARESTRLLNAVETAYETLTRERALAVYQNALAQLERDRSDREARLRAVQGTLAAGSEQCGGRSTARSADAEHREYRRAGDSALLESAQRRRARPLLWSLRPTDDEDLAEPAAQRSSGGVARCVCRDVARLVASQSFSLRGEAVGRGGSPRCSAARRPPGEAVGAPHRNRRATP